MKTRAAWHGHQGCNFSRPVSHNSPGLGGLKVIHNENFVIATTIDNRRHNLSECPIP